MNDKRRLFEVKRVHKNPSCYPHCSRGGALQSLGRCQCNALFRIGGDKRIAKCASKVTREVETKLRDLDRSLGGYAPNQTGPLVQ